MKAVAIILLLVLVAVLIIFSKVKAKLKEAEGDVASLKQQKEKLERDLDQLSEEHSNCNEQILGVAEERNKAIGVLQKSYLRDSKGRIKKFVDLYPDGL